MTRIRLVLLLAATVVLFLFATSQALATITPLPPTSASAKKAGEAILTVPSQLVEAEFPEYPYDEEEPLAYSAGVANVGSALTGFPTFGESYAILTSGNVETVATEHEQNYPEAISYAFEKQFSPNPAARGEARDWTVLRLNVNVPSGDNCLALDYRFLSEEYPTFVESEFNDAFIAELNSNNWTVNEDGSLTRPADFASSPTGEPISVDGVGPTAMSQSEAEGTYFNAATGLITTKTPIAAGPNSIYLSLFDASDQILDSAIFLDNLHFINEGPETCKPPVGAQLAIPVTTPTPAPTTTTTPAPAPAPSPPSNSFQLGSQVKFKGGSEATLSITVPGPGTVSASSTATAVGSSLTLDARAGAKGKKKKKPLLVPAKVQTAAAGTVHLTLKLSAAGKKALAQKGKLSVPVTVTFAPIGGTASSQPLKLTFKAKPKKKH